MKKLILTMALSVVMLSWSVAQELPRRVFLGIRMENLTEDTRKIMQAGELNGVLISEVIPQSTAESAGFKRGDLLQAVNGTDVKTTGEVIAALANYKAGDPFSYSLYRNKKHIKGKSVFRSFPEEKYTDLNVEYASIQSVAGKQRMIITKPRNMTKLPVIVFIGGIGCYSLDNALDTTRSESQLLNMLSRAGFMCVRPEKPGMGDNAKYSKPCAEISFNEELDGYVQAVLALKKRNDVDPSSVYLIGHSMGGLFAPLVAQQTAVKGIIAYGTIGSNFQEYLVKSRRTIGEAYGWAPDETDTYIKDYCECAGYYFIDKMTSEEAAQKKGDCRNYLSVFDYRSRKYNDELFALNIPAAWKPYEGKALLIWGESDYVSSKDDHKILTDAINFYHTGHAEMVTIPHTDHAMQAAESFSAARTNPGKYQPEVGHKILSWLQKTGS